VKIYVQSDIYGEEFEPLPDDIASDKYIGIPHKNELELGVTVVMDFADQHLADDMDTIQAIFSKKRAYARFKDFLDAKDALDKWHAFEAQALREWCVENEIKLK